MALVASTSRPTSELVPGMIGGGLGSRMLRAVRNRTQPSDRVPVFATFDL
jgi:hypothetical protein